MTPNKNVIFATHSEKIDQPRQVPSAELAQKIEFPSLFVSPTKISEKIPPSFNMSCLRSWTPPPFTKQGEETMIRIKE